MSNINKNENIASGELNEENQYNTPEIADIADEEIMNDGDFAMVEEKLSDDDLRKLVEFTTGMKPEQITDSVLETIRNNEGELERLIRVSYVKAKSFKYFPKKNFGVKYKKERQRKNRQARKQRAINRMKAKKSKQS